MNIPVPKTPKASNLGGSPTASATTSPSGSENSLLDDPPDYIAPNTQDMMFTDITSAILHSSTCTTKIGGGTILEPCGSIFSWQVARYWSCLRLQQAPDDQFALSPRTT
eukprot:scaffold13276_cov79-Cylindrotheca_fusiformis.AAC.4